MTDFQCVFNYMNELVSMNVTRLVWNNQNQIEGAILDIEIKGGVASIALALIIIKSIK